MKRIYLVPLVIAALLALTAAINPLLVASEAAQAAMPSESPDLPVSTTSAAYFVPVGYIALTCTSPTYYSMETTSSGAATTSDLLHPGARVVNGVALPRTRFINVAAGTQWLALLLKSGVQGYCLATQFSVDGVAGSFTTIAATSTASIGGAATFGTIVSSPILDGGAIIGTTLNTSGAAVIGGAASVTGDVTATTTKNKGSLTLNGASPSVITATVNSGAKCVCSNEDTTTNDVKCKVSSTTLTVTGPNGATDAVSYICL